MARCQLGAPPSRAVDVVTLSLLQVAGLSTATTAGAANGALIQAAINAAAAAGGGTVVIPAGRWHTTQLRLRTKVRLSGVGRWASELVLASGSNGHMVVLDSNQVRAWAVEHLTLDGQKTAQTAGNVLHLDSTGYAGTDSTTFLDDDTNGTVREVAVVNAYAHGVDLIGVRGANQLHSVFVFDAGGHGFLVESPDNLLDHCVAGNNGLNGFRTQGNGSASRMTTCKSFLSGRGDGTSGGFHLEFTSYTALINCEAQDNRGHGFVVIGETQPLIIGKSERNGLGPEPVTGNQGDGIYIQGTKDGMIVLTLGDRGSSDGTNPGALLQRRPYNCGPGNDRLNVTLSIGANKAEGAGSWGPNSVVQITGQATGGGTLPPVLTGPTVPLNFQTGSYTLTTADAGGRVIEVQSASANTVTIPANADVPIPVGTIIEVCQYGAGQTTIAAASGVTLRAPDGAKIAAQYGTASLRKRATNEWVLAGAVTT